MLICMRNELSCVWNDKIGIDCKWATGYGYKIFLITERGKRIHCAVRNSSVQARGTQ